MQSKYRQFNDQLNEEAGKEMIGLSFFLAVVAHESLYSPGFPITGISTQSALALLS